MGTSDNIMNRIGNMCNSNNKYIINTLYLCVCIMYTALSSKKRTIKKKKNGKIIIAVWEKLSYATYIRVCMRMSRVSSNLNPLFDLRSHACLFYCCY
jgi:hypothetical protein